MRPLVLASTSPRRKDLLGRLGVPFEVVPPSFEEDMTLEVSPGELAHRMALGKAQAVAADRPDAVVVGADTFIVHDGELLGKPTDGDDAFRTLQSLQGRDHSVITGFAVVEAGVLRTVEVVESYVRMRPTTDTEIERYVATGEPLDKAGAYALQGIGAMFISKVEGDVSAIIGLPLAGVAQALTRLGYVLPGRLD